MRYNQDALKLLARKPGEKEGRLLYKAPKETNEQGLLLDFEPVSVLVLEAFTVKMELPDENPFVLSICFESDVNRKHYFAGQSQQHCQDWVTKLKHISHSNLKAEFDFLRSQIKLKTGQDPLDAKMSQIKATKIVQPRPQPNGNSTFHVMTTPRLIQNHRPAPPRPSRPAPSRPTTTTAFHTNQPGLAAFEFQDILLPQASRPVSFESHSQSTGVRGNGNQSAGKSSSIFHPQAVAAPIQNAVHKVQNVMNRHEVGGSAFYDSSTTDVKTRFKEWETFD